MKRKILCAMVLSLGILCSSFTVSAVEETAIQEEEWSEDITPKPEDIHGWKSDENGWQYIDENGNFLKDCWKEINGSRYHFNKDGYMAEDWQIIEGNYYWFGSDGAMKKGWENVNGIYYNLGENGIMLTGWQFLKGSWYYLGAENDGAMKKGWELIHGDYYNFGEEGVMLTGWQSLGGYWYYLGTENDGAMKKGWELIHEKYYNLGEDGAMLTGWQSLGGYWYYLGTENDGAMKKGWEQVDGEYYNLGEDGIMLTGMQVINNDIYVLKSNGVMLADTSYSFNGGKLPIEKDGRVEEKTASVLKKAYQKLNEVGWDLRKAFNWSAGMQYYRMQNYGIGPAKNDIHSVWYGNYGFDNKKGNCYVMASTFCYMARLLGYETYYVEGQVPLVSGGLGPHGWCEIVIDGFTYVFDPDFTNNTGRNGFKIYYGMSGTWRYSNYKRVD